MLRSARCVAALCGLAVAGCGDDSVAETDVSPVDQDDADDGSGETAEGGRTENGKADAGAKGAGTGDAGTGNPAVRSDAGTGGGGDRDGGQSAPHEGGEAFGDWTYYQVPGAKCRDGSPAGYYIRRGDNADKNLMIFLNGGGVCFDSFFCAINPPNPDSSLPGETLLAASLDIVFGALVPERQVPPDAGIFKLDAQNPVGDWNMVYVPYCTGDVYGGTKEDALVPRAPELPPQQFVGYRNIGLFLDHFGPEFKGASQKVLLTGSSAGGFGTLLNFDRTQEYFGSKTLLYAVSDSGVPFRDELLEPCLQKEWRELWGLDAMLPKDCTGCFDASGGGLAAGLGSYIFKEKYKNRKVIGGGISTKQDEVIKLFFSAGLESCATEPLLEVVPAALGLGSYPEERYPAGLMDFFNNVAGPGQVGTYIMEGSFHQHLFRDRFYEENGVGTTIADWLSKILHDEATIAGTF